MFILIPYLLKSHAIYYVVLFGHVHYFLIADQSSEQNKMSAVSTKKLTTLMDFMDNGFLQ